MTLSPFQVRAFATVLLLWALYFLERGWFWPFLGAAALAMTARTEVGLVVAMFGLYALLRRRAWPFVVAPLVLGLGYFLVVMQLVVPAFVHLPEATCTGPVPIAQIQDKWPGGSNPNVGYYLQWGCTPGQILINLVSNPLYTLRYILLGPPPEALQGVPASATFIAQASRLPYLAAMLAPFAFLALLGPRGLVLGLPDPGPEPDRLAQRPDRLPHPVPDFADCRRGGGGGGGLSGAGGVAGPPLGVGGWGMGVRGGRCFGGCDARLSPWRVWLRREGLLLAVLAVAVIANGVMYNAGLRTLRSAHEFPARVAAANALVAEVPREASVAASSFLAPHLLPRRYIYNFPPAPYSPSFTQVQYVLVDPTGERAGKQSAAERQDRSARAGAG